MYSTCSVFAIALLLVVAGATTSWSAPGFHTVSGTTCSACNNAQADKLQRSHVRLLNPTSNNQSLWVLCSQQRVNSEIATGGIIGWVMGYFSAGVTNDINCVFREFNSTTVHVPGGTADPANTTNSVAFTINAPFSTPATAFTNVDPPVNSTVYTHYWTYACQLPPGTGINMLGMNMN